MGIQTDWLIIIQGNQSDLEKIQDCIKQHYYFFYTCEAEGSLLCEDAFEEEISPISPSPLLDGDYLVMHTHTTNLGYYGLDACIDITSDFPVTLYSVALCDDGDNWAQAEIYQNGTSRPKYNGTYYGLSLPEYLDNSAILKYLFDESYMRDILTDSGEEPESLQALSLLQLIQKSASCFQTSHH